MPNLVDGQYNSGGITVADKATASLQLDASGNLKVANSGSPSGTQDVNLTQIAGQSVTAGAGAVAAGTLRVTQASDSPAVTALQLLDNAVGTVAGGTAATASLLAGGVYNSTAPVLTDAQGAAAQLDAAGNLQTATGVRKAAATTPVAISFSGSGDNTIVSATASQTTRVHRLYIVVAGATSITFKTGAGTSLTGAMPLAANGGIMMDFSAEPWFVTGTNEAFIINSSAAVQVSGRAEYLKSA